MRVIVVMCCVPSLAFASGFYMTENGSKALMQGGAFGAEADDVTALVLNPAGLAQLGGLNFAADLELLSHSVSFQRFDPGFDPNNPPASLVSSVSNTAGIFPLPFLGASYGFDVFGHRVSVALGIYGPPGPGKYTFPDPDYTKVNGKYVTNPKKAAPQRYSLIENNIVIVYPTLSVAVEATPRMFFGGSLQIMYAQAHFKQAVYSGLVTPMRLADEDPLFDSTVTVDATAPPTLTGILGALFKPFDWLAIGFSLRPPIALHASGTLTFNLGEAATGLNTKVTGNLKVGAKVTIEYRMIATNVAVK